ncbi:hypothetical protein PDK22_26205 [Bacillus cereus group sp. BY122LC]|uniref:hypothetical protein n=1 Tax=Bacillus cereus group sp. BY122LC TaxID=3018085 RepID=UPI0022DFBCA7|nr:hypothetical protein [Bacillus cereus group sp. BY122LC]MDA1861183.1 hypothetical protein [Bacillus cereus group sp. BY122LC]
MQFLLIKCITDVIISGRNEDGAPDHCFIKGKEYDMCFDEKKGNCFTIDEVKMMHFVGCENDYYFDKHFEVVKNLKDDDFKDNELRLQRLKRMAKEKYNYEE